MTSFKISKRIITLLTGVMILFLTSISKAQTISNIGFKAGINWYQGDLSKELIPSSPGFQSSVLVRKRISSPIWLGLSAGVISAGATSMVLDMKLQAEYHFFDFRKIDDPYSYSPYIVTGVGYTSIPNNFYIPLGLGFKTKVNRLNDLEIELTGNFTFTDDLEKFYYPNGNNLTTLNNDLSDSFVQLSIVYSINFIKISCPRSIPPLFF